MRVGFIVGEFPLLSETFVIDQMAGLIARGFEIEVLCNRVRCDDRIDRQSEPMVTLLGATRRWWGWAAGLGAVAAREIVHGDASATRAQGFRDRASDAAAGAGDQSNLGFHVRHMETSGHVVAARMIL